MRAYVQADAKGEFYNVNAFVAYEGFRNFGYEVLKYHSVEEIADLDPEAVLVGGIGNVRRRLELLGTPRTGEEKDYPESLMPFLGRKVWESTVEEIFKDEKSWNIFLKPKETTKKFTGKLVTSYKDFIDILDPNEPTPVWCSEPVNFVAEYRCFIRYGEILDIRHYKGVWDAPVKVETVKAAIAAYQDAPAAYSLDFGSTDDARFLLVEVNDGHSLGSYGIASYHYAKFLSARWAEMTHTDDFLKF